MKNIINVKEIMIILISLLLITLSTNVFAAGAVIGGGNNQNGNEEFITGTEYENAQKNDVNNNISNNTNNGNTNNNDESLPQTGVEDYGTGILLIICIASTIFAYKKISDYRNI